MITGYSRGGITLTADYHVGSSQVTLTVTRTVEFTDDGVRRLNIELADYGAELIPNPDTSAGGWVLLAGGQVLAADSGADAQAVLTGTVYR